jgi:predicted ATPase
MLTRIEIDGFKSFQKFAVDLRPFQVFVGPNGGGKSNLFDAIQLLSQLMRNHSLYKAFRLCRGDIGDLFTVAADGTVAKTMRFAVEVLVAPQITDDFGVDTSVSATRLRYELTLERRSENGFERLFVTHESLAPIPEKLDKWFRANIPVRNRKLWVIRKRREAYLSTSTGDGRIFLHQDKRSGKKQEIPLVRLDRTVLGSVNDAEYPTAYAMRREMQAWDVFCLNSTTMRMAAPIYQPAALLPDGSNLAAVYQRMARDDGDFLQRVSEQMATFVPGMGTIIVEPVPEGEAFRIVAKGENGRRFSSAVFADGALRMLALLALSQDVARGGVICLEEPEQGIFPAQLPDLATLLRGWATDFDADAPLLPRQILMNTHSPVLPTVLDVDELLFVHRPAGRPCLTCVNAVVSQLPLFSADETAAAAPDRDYTISEVLQQLNPGHYRARQPDDDASG